MNIDYYLLTAIITLPFLYKYSFWFFSIQLKEYRVDRFREYLFTKQWKRAFFNILTILELALFLSFLALILLKIQEKIFYNVFMIFFLFENIFVLFKLFSSKILKPKLTWRLIITILILSILLYLWFFFIETNDLCRFIYFYVLFLFICSPLLIFISIFISLPFLNYFKKKKIEKAKNKSIKINKPIKIWITWSYWKSSVKEFLASILEQDSPTLKTPKNINSELWVTQVVLDNLDNKYKYFVCEMWAYKIGEIDTLWEIVNHKYGFLTAIWNQHIWLFGSQENIIKWKSEILRSVLKNRGVLYVNFDNEFIKNIKFDKKLSLVRYWSNSLSDAIFKIKDTNNWKTSFSFKYKKIDEVFEVNLIWKHNILNLSWVIAFCYDLGFDTKKIKKYLKNLKTPKNTLNVIKKDNLTLIDDTYNLSRDWLYAWLDFLYNFTWKKILVMDDILELWKDANKIHYDLWKYISKKFSLDKMLFCWVNYRDDFVRWLLDWGYKKSDILSSLSPLPKKDLVILFEWRNSRKYLMKLWKNV